MRTHRWIEWWGTLPKIHPVLSFFIPVLAFALYIGGIYLNRNHLTPEIYAIGMMPVLVSALLLGLRGGFPAAVISILLNIFFILRFVPIAYSPSDVMPTTVMGSILLLALGMLVGVLREIARDLSAVNGELTASLKKVKTLSGLLPICANCKRIRDDDGSWHQVEAYVTEHSEAGFTHGLCPECMKALYPDIVMTNGDSDRN